MRRPSPPRPKKRTKCNKSDTESTNNNKMKGSGNTTTTALKLTNSYYETHKKTTKTEVVVISSSNHTKSTSFSDKDDSKDYDSTASTPKVDRKKLPKIFYATEKKKAPKARKTMNFGSASEPPKLKVTNEWTGTLDAKQYARIKTNLFCHPEEEDDNDFYLNYHPSSIIGYEGFDDMGFTIPEWMPMTFRPTRKMSLNKICASTAAYIFMSDVEQQKGEELLVKTTSGVYGDRTALKSLMPRAPVDQQIINLVVARCNWLIDNARSKSVWYFPAEFAQYALDANYSPDYVTKIYKSKFMKTSVVSKIFIPMNDDGNHWYLVAVDIYEKKTFWLDSLPCDERFHIRRHAILELLLFLEKVLLGESFRELVPNIRDNLITDFPIEQPKGLQQQRHGSNDCGVWVAKWMIECPYNNLYETVNVVTATRMKLAIFLCQSWNNIMVNDLVTKAAHYWEAETKKRNDLIKV